MRTSNPPSPFCIHSTKCLRTPKIGIRCPPSKSLNKKFLTSFPHLPQQQKKIRVFLVTCHFWYEWEPSKLFFDGSKSYRMVALNHCTSVPQPPAQEKLVNFPVFWPLRWSNILDIGLSSFLISFDSRCRLNPGTQFGCGGNRCRNHIYSPPFLFIQTALQSATRFGDKTLFHDWINQSDQQMIR